MTTGKCGLAIRSLRIEEPLALTYMLGRLHCEDTRTLLETLFHIGPGVVREACLTAFGGSPEQTSAFLKRVILSKKSVKLCDRALYALGCNGYAPDLGFLLELLHASNNPHTTASIIEGIGENVKSK